MEFYGIEMKGPFSLEMLNTKPEFQISDTGRMIYVIDEKVIYYGDDEKWNLVVGGNYVATLQEVIDGVVDNKFISPSKLSQIKALSSDLITGTDNVKYITSLSLRGLKASVAEAYEGTNDIKYVTPAGLKNFADNNPGILPGTIIYYTKNSAPSGYLKANGSAISRTTYSDLFNVIGTTFGVGDGSTTFNLPDLRGEFIRGWVDDKSGVDDGRVFGSSQGDAIRNLTGSWSSQRVAYGVASVSGIMGQSTYFGRTADESSGSYTTSGTINIDASRQVPTADENRPRNIALLACIKY